MPQLVSAVAVIGQLAMVMFAYEHGDVVPNSARIAATTCRLAMSAARMPKLQDIAVVALCPCLKLHVNSMSKGLLKAESLQRHLH